MRVHRCTFDVAVIGLGAMGAATLYQLAKRGVRAVGIDQYSPPHIFGSTHGETRITRQAIGEGAHFVPLVLRSHQLWREIETETGSALFAQCGGLITARSSIGNSLHGRADFLGTTFAAARQYNIAHERLDAREIAYRYPQFELRGDEVGYYEPGAGCLQPEACVTAQLSLARASGADTRVGRARCSQEDGADVVIEVDGDRLIARKVVFAAGGWVAGLVPALSSHLRVTRQVLHWFPTDGKVSYTPDDFPVFIHAWGASDDEVFYGFPSVNGGRTVKVATEQRQHSTDPDQTTPPPTAEESEAFYRRHVAGRLRGLLPQLDKAATCFYTVAPNANFIVDQVPTNPHATVISACSGHGFKHSAAIGEAVAEWIVSGVRPAVLSPFAWPETSSAAP